MGPEVTWGEGEAVSSQQSPVSQGAEQDWSVGCGGKEGPGAFLLLFLSEICESLTTLLQSTRNDCTKGLVSTFNNFNLHNRYGDYTGFSISIFMN